MTREALWLDGAPCRSFSLNTTVIPENGSSNRSRPSSSSVDANTSLASSETVSYWSWYWYFTCSERQGLGLGLGLGLGPGLVLKLWLELGLGLGPLLGLGLSVYWTQTVLTWAFRELFTIRWTPRLIGGLIVENNESWQDLLGHLVNGFINSLVWGVCGTERQALQCLLNVSTQWWNQPFHPTHNNDDAVAGCFVSFSLLVCSSTGLRPSGTALWWHDCS